LRPEFIGKIILLEGYDMALARKLVTGVDVWVNTPEYPLEASGTSGQKAAINGVINLSVLDGWWGEGFDGENGWAIHPHARDADASLRDHEESADLLDILENEIIPLYYEHGGQGYSVGWVQKSKASMKSCMPRFNSQRMVVDYVKKFYAPARTHSQRLAESDHEPARRLAEWKEKIHHGWKSITIDRIDEAQPQIHTGESLPIVIQADLNGLDAEDVIVECVVGNRDDNGKLVPHERFQFERTGMEGNKHIFKLDLKPSRPGLNHYKLRIYPWHELLGHPFEMGYMIWI
jgi:starch phosphorylase